MTSSQIAAEYNEQKGYYYALDDIRQALVAISGAMEAANYMFDVSGKDMTKIVDAVMYATIVLDSFEPYKKLLKDCLTLVKRAQIDADTYQKAADGALKRVEADMEMVHDYMAYLDMKRQEFAEAEANDEPYPSFSYDDELIFKGAFLTM